MEIISAHTTSLADASAAITALSPVAHDRWERRATGYRPASELPALQFLEDPYDPSFGRLRLRSRHASVARRPDTMTTVAAGIIWLARAS